MLRLILLIKYWFLIRAAPSTAIGIGVGPIPALFGSIGIGKVCYTSTKSTASMSYLLLKVF